MTIHTTHHRPAQTVITANIPVNPRPAMAVPSSTDPRLAFNAALDAMKRMAAVEDEKARDRDRSRQSGGMGPKQAKQVAEKKAERLVRVCSVLSGSVNRTRFQVAKDLGSKPETVIVWLNEAIEAGLVTVAKNSGTGVTPNYYGLAK